MPPQEKVAILDAGSQFGKLIDHQIRALHVECDMLPLDTPLATILEKGYLGLIISGGPSSVYEPGAPQCDPTLLTNEKTPPILGICYGMQLINKAHGGIVAPLTENDHKVREDGVTEIVLTENNSRILKANDTTVLLTHGDSVTPTTLAKGFVATALSQHGQIVAAMENQEKRQYCVQFHPEVELTPTGSDMMKRFLVDVCGCSCTYTQESHLNRAIAYVQERVGDSGHVLSLVSGGVDSSVCTALIARAIGPSRVHALHIDSGLMRLNESENVVKALSALGVSVAHINATDQFLDALSGLTDPEKKRHAIGDTFMRVVSAYEKSHLADIAKQVPLFVAQGTLRPDLIESASHMVSGKASVIKTHHNDTALVRELRAKGRVIEPLSELHKDEVRIMGEALGLPSALVWRQPFPGPGLAIRTLCSKGSLEADGITNFHELDDKVIEYLWHTAFEGVLLPIRTVGVQGDARSYSGCVAIWQKNAGPMQKSGEIDWVNAFKIAAELPKHLPVNRVWYVFMADDAAGLHLVGDPDDLKCQPTTITAPVLDQLRLADHEVMSAMQEAGVERRLAQVCTVSIPLEKRRGMAVRTMLTHDFMTGRASVPGKDSGTPHELIDDIVKRLFERVRPEIGFVWYDMTSKPPSTVEVE